MNLYLELQRQARSFNWKTGQLRMARVTKYEWCRENADADKEFLGWIYSRLQDVFGERFNSLHMQRLDNLISAMPGELPKPPIQRQINEAIWANLWDKSRPETNIAPMDIVRALEKAGLEIVEKKSKIAIDLNN